MDNLTKQLLAKIANLHEIPAGAVSIRKNGKSEYIKSSKNILIQKKADLSGIDIRVKSTTKGEVCHIPVVVTQQGLFDQVYNDFYIEDGAEVTIVAGCGLHSDADAGHNGIHRFHIGKNANVVYVENHLAMGKGNKKELSPTTEVYLGENSCMTMNTTQISGVSYADRKTKAHIANNASLVVNEKIKTDHFDVAKTQFRVDLIGKNSKCNIISRSVAQGESEQIFRSELIGKNECFGHVECDGILLNNAMIQSVPKVTAKSNLASLSHEAAIGKIAGEQIIKLMTLGLTQTEAEQKIIEGFLK